MAKRIDKETSTAPLTWRIQNVMLLSERTQSIATHSHDNREKFEWFKYWAGKDFKKKKFLYNWRMVSSPRSFLCRWLEDSELVTRSLSGQHGFLQLIGADFTQAFILSELL